MDILRIYRQSLQNQLGEGKKASESEERSWNSLLKQSFMIIESFIEENNL